MQDKWQLISWGLRQKQSMTFRKHFLTCTDQLKDRFKIILGRFLQKRADKEFEDMKNMIMNFDKEQKHQFPDKSKSVTDIKKGKVNVDINNFDLDVVMEQEEMTMDDLDEESVMQKENVNSLNIKEV